MAPLNVESFLAYEEHDGGQHPPDPDDEISLFDDSLSDAGAPNEDLSADQGEPRQEEPSMWEDDRDDEDPDPTPDDEEPFDYTAHFQDDDIEEDVDSEDHHPSYFTLFRPSNDSSPARQDQEHGMTITSPAFMAYTGQKRGVKVHTPIAEATVDVLLPTGETLRSVNIKIDICNSRNGGGRKFLGNVKPCQEYGFPPIRMRTASKALTAWRKDMGTLTYKDRDGIQNVALCYVDDDNPDLVLLDMATIFHSDIDAMYHARTSLRKGAQPLKRNSKAPYHWEAYRFLRSSKGTSNRGAQNGGKSATPPPTSYTTSPGDCQCSPRIAQHSMLIPYNLYVQMLSEIGVSHQQHTSDQANSAGSGGNAGGTST